MRNIVALCLCLALTVSGVSKMENSMFSLSWKLGPNIPRPVVDYMSGWVNGKLIIAGGTYWIENQKNGEDSPQAKWASKGSYGVKYWSTRVDAYNPQNNTWSSLPNLPLALAFGRGITVNNVMYIIGGTTVSDELDKDGNRKEPVVRDCYKLIEKNGHYTWIKFSTLPEDMDIDGVVAIDDTIYLLGGPDYLKVWKYNLKDKNATWENLGKSPIHWQYMGIAAVKKRIYSFGGYQPETESNHNEVYYFDTQTNQWHQVSNLPFANRTGYAAPFQDKYIFLFGGNSASGEQTKKNGPTYGYLSTVLVYDAIHDTFAEAKDSMPRLTCATDFYIIGHSIYGAAGENAQGKRSPYTMIGVIKNNKI
jgi:N-acetylneuraminic acid mutarotase